MLDKKQIKRGFVFLVVILFVFALFFIFLNKRISAQEQQQSFCCEKTTAGNWCQPSPPAECASGFRKAPTSCESTSYCKLGTCVNVNTGQCTGNTPQIVCQNSGGVWFDKKEDEIPQCKRGCCFIGQNTAFVNQIRCKTLASDYGTNTTFRPDINSESECILSANPDVEGACVLEKGFERSCKRTTRSECISLEKKSSSDTKVQFHEGLLCTAEVLATQCAPTSKTTCVENKDEVYFIDSCGNIANVYDSSKVNNQEYWTYIKDPAESCNPDSSNANSASCGNCNYLLGSLCKAYRRNDPQTPVKPSYGDFVCADLSCKYQGKTYQHGERWCGTTGTKGNENSPGSEHAVFACYSGEVTVTLCDPFRNTVCIEEEVVPGFKSAGCVANRWDDCVLQTSKQDCENRDVRDCKWVEGQSILKDDSGNPLVVNERGELVERKKDDTRKGASCLPLYPPGFNFWEEGNADELCAIASDTCLVKFQKGLLGDWECKENCECLGLKKGDSIKKATTNNKWFAEKMNMCISLGDCGEKLNYLGQKGFINRSIVRWSEDYKG
ncbi:MAG: hypothetical protein KatS3mg001_436 [Candidatus Pacearchaeota archaeon]|nr:MAG: hypothetical protein KatS3mg001_436 [Candidatus Pacearchaeota archaeon]